MFYPQAKKSRLCNLTAWVASEDISSGFIIQEDEEGVGERTEPPSWPRNGMDKKVYHKVGWAKNVRKLGKTLEFQTRQRSYLFYLLCLPRITRCPPSHVLFLRPKTVFRWNYKIFFGILFDCFVFTSYFFIKESHPQRSYLKGWPHYIQSG